MQLSLIRISQASTLCLLPIFLCCSFGYIHESFKKCGSFCILKGALYEGPRGKVQQNEVILWVKNHKLHPRSLYEDPEANQGNLKWYLHGIILERNLIILDPKMKLIIKRSSKKNSMRKMKRRNKYTKIQLNPLICESQQLNPCLKTIHLPYKNKNKK